MEPGDQNVKKVFLNYPPSMKPQLEAKYPLINRPYKYLLLYKYIKNLSKIKVDK